MIIIKTNKNYYRDIDACKDSITVGELIKELQKFSKDDKIITTTQDYLYGNIGFNSLINHK